MAKVKTVQAVKVYEREMKEVQKKEAFEKIKQGMQAKDEGQVISGAKTTAVQSQRDKKLRKQLEE